MSKSMRLLTVATTILLFTVVLSQLNVFAKAAGEGSARDLEKADDVKTLDGVIKAYYEVVSGPAGEAPDYKRDANLHHPNALISVASVDKDGKPRLAAMSLKGFYERFGGSRKSAFYEWEIHRKTERFGNIANVWSTYVSSDKPNGKPITRGINNIQLFFDGQRWWIMSWIYDNEREGNPIPEEYLPKN